MGKSSRGDFEMLPYALPPSMADSSHPWVAAPMAQRVTRAHSVPGCFHLLCFSSRKLSLSSSSRDNPSWRGLSKAQSFWARKAPFKKCSWYRLRPVSCMKSSTLLLSSVSSRRLKGACIGPLGSWMISGVIWERLLLRRCVAIAPKVELHSFRMTTSRGYSRCQSQFQPCTRSEV